MTVALLVVDDEPDIEALFQRRFRRELRDGTHALHFANSADRALQMLEGGVEPRVMLILSDINMPGMTGMELLGRTKARWPEPPVAMITAYGDPENRARALALGAAEVLSKPIDFQALKRRLPALMAGDGGH